MPHVGHLDIILVLRGDEAGGPGWGRIIHQQIVLSFRFSFRDLFVVTEEHGDMTGREKKRETVPKPRPANSRFGGAGPGVRSPGDLVIHAASQHVILFASRLCDN